MDPWYEDFNLISEEFEPRVEASDYSLTETIIQAIFIALNGYGIYTNGKTYYYYGATGVAMGKFVSRIFISADAWAGSGIITPTDPWVLYNAQAPDATNPNSFDDFSSDEPDNIDDFVNF